MKFKLRTLLPALLAGSTMLGAAEAKPLSERELFDATVKHVDMGGLELQYQNLRGLNANIAQLLKTYSSLLGSLDGAATPQVQMGFQAVEQLLAISGIDSIQATAYSLKASGGQDCTMRTFLYTGANPQGLLFDIGTRENRAFALTKNIPADALLAAGTFLSPNALWEGIKKNAAPGSALATTPLMLEMQYEQMTQQKLSALLESISGEYLVVGRAAGKGGEFSGELLVSIPDKDGVLGNLLKQNLGPMLQPGKDGVLLVPRTPDMPEWAAPQFEIGNGRVIIASNAAIADASRAGNGENGPLVKEVAALLPQDGKGSSYIALNIPQSLLDEAAVLVPPMKSVMRSEGGIYCYYAGFVAPEGYAGTAKMNFQPTSAAITMYTVAMQAGMMLPALNSARGKAQTISCTSNLKQIGLGLMMYATDNDDKLPAADGPAGLEELRKKGYLKDAKVFNCPSGDLAAVEDGEELNFDNCSYLYFGGFELSKVKNPSYIPLAIELNDHNGMVNVLFMDGHVQGFKVADPDPSAVIEFLAEQNKLPQDVKDTLLGKIKKLSE